MSVVLTNLRESLAQGHVTDHLRALDDALTTEGVVDPVDAGANAFVEVSRDLDRGDVGAELGGVLELDTHSLSIVAGGIALLT